MSWPQGSRQVACRQVYVIATWRRTTHSRLNISLPEAISSAQMTALLHGRVLLPCAEVRPVCQISRLQHGLGHTQALSLLPAGGAACVPAPAGLQVGLHPCWQQGWTGTSASAGRHLSALQGQQALPGGYSAPARPELGPAGLQLRGCTGAHCRVCDRGGGGAPACLASALTAPGMGRLQDGC